MIKSEFLINNMLNKNANNFIQKYIIILKNGRNLELNTEIFMKSEQNAKRNFTNFHLFHF